MRYDVQMCPLAAICRIVIWLIRTGNFFLGALGAQTIEHFSASNDRDEMKKILKLPLIMICGTSVSGKTSRAIEMKNFFVKEHGKKEGIVSEVEAIVKFIVMTPDIA
ncbi:hypothetical protein PYW08_011244 [Mythimna loreyi]|uniref:Uncharacterized protein n=1 Tax=Mythimna loreyi TaxID=667449 RepID=A0ACC2Q6C9_9NEOP|nr:hypothetical protein PYW08_011244 [Mythimna loreyi]